MTNSSFAPRVECDSSIPVVCSTSPGRSTSRNSNSCSPWSTRKTSTSIAGSSSAACAGAMENSTANIGKAIIEPHGESAPAASSWSKGCEILRQPGGDVRGHASGDRHRVLAQLLGAHHVAERSPGPADGAAPRPGRPRHAGRGRARRQARLLEQLGARQPQHLGCPGHLGGHARHRAGSGRCGRRSMRAALEQHVLQHLVPVLVPRDDARLHRAAGDLGHRSLEADGVLGPHRLAEARLHPRHQPRVAEEAGEGIRRPGQRAEPLEDDPLPDRRPAPPRRRCGWD